MDALRRTLIVVSVVTLGAQATLDPRAVLAVRCPSVPWDARSGHEHRISRHDLRHGLRRGHRPAIQRRMAVLGRRALIEATASAPWAPREL